MDLVMAEKHIRSRIGTHLLPRVKNSQMEQQLELDLDFISFWGKAD
jgi:hypothetical protein